MAEDIVERLTGDFIVDPKDAKEAAAEITALRAEVERLTALLKDLGERYTHQGNRAEAAEAERDKAEADCAAMRRALVNLIKDLEARAEEDSDGMPAVNIGATVYGDALDALSTTANKALLDMLAVVEAAKAETKAEDILSKYAVGGERWNEANDTLQIANSARRATVATLNDKESG